MKIEKVCKEDYLEIKLAGKLDSTWAEVFQKSVEDSIRENFFHLRIDVADVIFLSSAGIRAILLLHRQISSVKGSLYFRNPSKQFKDVILLSGLDSFLEEPVKIEKSVLESTSKQWSDKVEIHGNTWEYRLIATATASECVLMGSPDSLENNSLASEKPLEITLFKKSLAFGLGQFSGEETTKPQYGEFMAVGSTAIFQPTDRNAIPDFIVSRTERPIQAALVYGVHLDADALSFARFSHASKKEMTLSQIAGSVMEISKQDSLILVMLAETRGLVGARISQIPINQKSGDHFFRVGQLRKSMSFSQEPLFQNHLALTIGIVSRRNVEFSEKFLRPMVSDTSMRGHFHAAPFRFKPLQKGELEMFSTIGELFDQYAPRAVLHLLNNPQNAEYSESRFSQGAVWFTPVSFISKPGAKP